jgi:Bacterial Ig-like domain (group 2)/FlgD Ig-like domain/Cohesin domain
MRIAILAVCALLASAAFGPARAVTLDIGNGAGTVGDTVLVAITTTDLTGLGVYSYELAVTWSASYATAIGAPVTGTVSSPWGAATVNATPGRIEIAAAGAVALTGSGNLITLEFVLGPSAGTITLTFSEFLFNEGTPTHTLVNGQLTITALPIVNISPNSGEILAGETLNFSASGGAAPYTFTSSNNAVATFGGTAILSGVSPGSVTATATDNNGVTRTTSGVINVRALRLTVGSASASPGDTVLIAVSITDPSPYAIKSAEFDIAYNESYFTALGVSQAGTIAATAGWATPTAAVAPGNIGVALAGPNSLAGPGVLTYLKFVIDPITFNVNSGIAASNALFNETYPSINVGGSISVTVLSSITVTPNTSTIVVGDMLQFYISGVTAPPVTWGVTNGGVATIDGTGQLTATAAGTTRVHATDNVGRTDMTDIITICDLYLIAPTQTVFYGFPTPVPIQTDRSVTGLGIYGYELTLSFDPSKVLVAGVSTGGTASAPWGMPVFNTSLPGKVVIVHAGATPLAGTLPLVNVLFQTVVGQVIGTSTALTITKILFNEGDPCALVQNGSLVTGLNDRPQFSLDLEQNIPNPFNPRTTIFYRVGRSGRASMRVYRPDGSLVRTLVDGAHEAGVVNRAEWDGTDDGGRRVASGVYFYRLESANDTRTKKMILLK